MLDEDKEARNDVRDIKTVFLRHLERGQLNQAGTAIKPTSIAFQSGHGGEGSNVIGCDLSLALSVSSSHRLLSLFPHASTTRSSLFLIASARCTSKYA